ncbi:hypothetical protein HHK36_025367 [Tetracentron sinense]|uniref:Uncharacterized protein n=1 Tax=Tetracentron sinense TaxID=13715 RepID=A0A834YMH7_TETSI|nr:hypothetical protein HHK36_025367 [Tetracentron sinense]
MALGTSSKTPRRNSETLKLQLLVEFLLDSVTLVLDCSQRSWIDQHEPILTGRFLTNISSSNHNLQIIPRGGTAGKSCIRSTEREVLHDSTAMFYDKGWNKIHTAPWQTSSFASPSPLPAAALSSPLVRKPLQNSELPDFCWCCGYGRLSSGVNEVIKAVKEGPHSGACAGGNLGLLMLVLLLERINSVLALKLRFGGLGVVFAAAHDDGYLLPLFLPQDTTGCLSLVLKLEKEIKNNIGLAYGLWRLSFVHLKMRVSNDIEGKWFLYGCAQNFATLDSLLVVLLASRSSDESGNGLPKCSRN